MHVYSRGQSTHIKRRTKVLHENLILNKKQAGILQKINHIRSEYVISRADSNMYLGPNTIISNFDNRTLNKLSYI